MTGKYKGDQITQYMQQDDEKSSLCISASIMYWIGIWFSLPYEPLQAECKSHFQTYEKLLSEIKVGLVCG